MPPSALLALLLLPAIIYVSGFLHELGHAVCASLSGAEVTSFGMGIGRPFWVGTWRGGRVYLGRRKPFQGRERVAGR